VELKCNSVEEMLLNFERDDISNLPHLLYNLQIIEVLMQPADSADELEKQQEYIGDVDHSLLLAWPDEFDQKKGYLAIVRAFEWLQFALSRYIHSTESSAVKGVSSNILHQTVALEAKLLRSFLTHFACHVASPLSIEKLVAPSTELAS
jgi:hypothetical protein